MYFLQQVANHLPQAILGQFYTDTMGGIFTSANLAQLQKPLRKSSVVISTWRLVHRQDQINDSWYPSKYRLQKLPSVKQIRIYEKQKEKKKKLNK